eukprot:3666347-Alexandrium_andersonii.AAC.1
MFSVPGGPPVSPVRAALDAAGTTPAPRKKLSGDSMHLATQAAWTCYVLGHIAPREVVKIHRCMPKLPKQSSGDQGSSSESDSSGSDSSSSD